MAFIVKQGIKYEIESKYYTEGLNLQEKETITNPLGAYHIKMVNCSEGIREDYEDKKSSPEKMGCNSFDKNDRTSNNLQPSINIMEDLNELEDKGGLYGKYSLSKIKDSMQHLYELKKKHRSGNKYSRLNKIKDALHLLREIQKDTRNKVYDNDESRDKNRYLSKIQEQINHAPKITNENHQDELCDKNITWIKYHYLSKIQDLINRSRKINEDHNKNESRNENRHLSEIQDQIDLFLKIENRDHMDELNYINESRDKSIYVSEIYTMNLSKKAKIESNEESLYGEDESRVEHCHLTEMQDTVQFFQDIKNENSQDELDLMQI